jgi:hypothetical protein
VVCQEGDQLVKAVEKEMDALRATHASAVAELQGRLQWYTENQELLSKNDELLGQQSDTIARLQERLAYYEGAVKIRSHRCAKE